MAIEWHWLLTSDLLAILAWLASFFHKGQQVVPCRGSNVPCCFFVQSWLIMIHPSIGPSMIHPLIIRLSWYELFPFFMCRIVHPWLRWDFNFVFCSVLIHNDPMCTLFIYPTYWWFIHYLDVIEGSFFILFSLEYMKICVCRIWFHWRAIPISRSCGAHSRSQAIPFLLAILHYGVCI